MREQRRVGVSARIRLAVAITGITLTVIILSSVAAFADDAMDAQQLVERARMTTENFLADADMEIFRDHLKQAKGVFIAPQVFRGAFVFGASGGSGVLLARDEKGDSWNGPAFYTIGQVSFGLQAGAEASEVALLAMSERGVAALQSNSVKLGADVGIAVGPFGGGAAAATANLSADIVIYARSKGLYGGISVDGAVVATRDALNRAYYGQDVTPTDILIRRTVMNPQAAGLIDLVTKAAGTK
jgi:SH3 domain-containing YSC84-like protein 1